MSMMKFLKEDLQSLKIFDGPKAMYTPDTMKGAYTSDFKIGPTTYEFTAKTYADDEYSDSCWRVHMGTKMAGDTESIPDEDDVIKGFVEAIEFWLNDVNPHSFYWEASTLHEAYNKIAEAICKKFKDYTCIDETKDDTDELADGITREGNPVGRFKFTKEEPKETVEKPEDWYERETEAPKDTFDKFENPKEIPTEKSYMTYEKDSKLDKVEGNSFIDYVKNSR